MLWFCCFFTVELVEGVVEIPMHQNVDMPFFIIPFHDYPAVQ